MKLLCARPASFHMPGLGEVKRGEVFELPTAEGFPLLYNVSTQHLFCEQPPFRKFLYKRRGGGEYRWVLRHERRELTRPEWEPVSPEEAFTRAEHVLLIRQMGLGDMLMLTPTIRAIANLGKRVSVLTFDQYVPLFEGNPHLERAWGFETYAEHGFEIDTYDAFAELMWFVEYDEANAEVPRIDLFAKGAGVELETRTLDYYIRPDETEWALEALGDAPRPWIAVQQGAFAKQRRVLPTLITNICASLPGTPVVLGHEEIELPPHAIDLVGVTTIRQAAAMIAVCDLAIAPDSGLAHISAAVGTPCVVLSSSIDPKLRYSYYPDHAVINGAQIASCQWGYCNDAYHCDAPEYPPCLQAITTKHVMAAVNKTLPATEAQE